VLAVEPIRTTLGYGQVNTLLMALVVADLLPRPSPGRAGDLEGSRRRIPQGALIGLAAAIKLTPALFVVFAFFLGRRRLAFTGIASFVAFTAVGAIFQPAQTIAFWTGLSGGQTRTASPVYAGNQSLLGVFFRLAGSSRTTTLVGLGFAAIVALLAALVAAHWWREGQRVFAVGLVGLATCLASPLSWTHHYVWIVPMAVAVVLQRPTPGRRPLPRWARGLAGFWVLWVCACLPLAVLPYGGGRERHFTFLQSTIANLGPALGVVLVAGLAWQLVVTTRAQAADRASLGIEEGGVKR
jgi:alpha-1,2-mannosyltransferase